MSPTPEKAELDEIELNLNYRFVPRLRRLIANLSPTSAAAVPSEQLEEAITHICNWFTYQNDHWKHTLGDLIRANVGPLLAGFPVADAAAQPKVPSPSGLAAVREELERDARLRREQPAPRPTPAETPAPQAKRMDARILSKADLDRLSSVAWNYARESTTVRVGDYLQDVASLRGHIDALEAEAAAQEKQLKTVAFAWRVAAQWLRDGSRCRCCGIDPATPHGSLIADGHLPNCPANLTNKALAALTNGAGA